MNKMAEKKIKITIDKDGNLSIKTDGFDHSTLDSLEMLDALLEDLVDELPEEELTPEGRKSKANKRAQLNELLRFVSVGMQSRVWGVWKALVLLNHEAWIA